MDFVDRSLGRFGKLPGISCIRSAFIIFGGIIFTRSADGGHIRAFCPRPFWCFSLPDRDKPGSVWCFQGSGSGLWGGASFNYLFASGIDRRLRINERTNSLAVDGPQYKQDPGSKQDAQWISSDFLKVSVIVPVKDMAETLKTCLDALLNQKSVIYNQDYEVIVVDDGSGDQSADVARRAGVVVYQQKNLGPAAARNAGARLARGNIFAFTDADCAPDQLWVLNIIQAFSNPEVVGIKGTYRTQQKEMVARFVQQEYAYKYERMAHLDKIDFIDTYSAAYRKDIFLQNNGFDERFPTFRGPGIFISPGLKRIQTGISP